MFETSARSIDPVSPVTFNEVLARLLEQACATIDECPRTAGDHLREARRLLGLTGPEALPVRPGASKGGLAPWQVNRIKSYIGANLSHHLSGPELAGVVRLSPGHFCRAFKASFGVSPHTYVRDHRVSAAQELMMASEASLAEIAATCGFSDQSHLCHMFRRKVGMSPAAWRRRQKTLGPAPSLAETARMAPITLAA